MSQESPWRTIDDPFAARRALADLRVGALWLHCSAMLTAEVAGEVLQLPLLHIDPEGRADVGDVVGATRREGMLGTANITWRFVAFPGAVEGIMSVATTVPIRCRFAVAISARMHREPLQQIAEAGYVALATICPQTVGETPPAIWVKLNDLGIIRAVLARESREQA